MSKKKKYTPVKKTGTIDDGHYKYDYDLTKKETGSGLFISAGEVKNEFDNVDWRELLEDYTQMRNGGAVESTTVSILKYPLLRAGYYIQTDDQKQADYINWCFENLIDSFGNRNGMDEFLNHLLLALDYGCSFFEKIYSFGVKDDRNKVTNVISQLAPFKPESIYWFNFTDDLIFSGIRHERRGNLGNISFIEVPVQKLFFYSHNTEFGDPRGRSELRPARMLYKLKKEILISMARSMQRGAGIPEIKSLKKGISDAEMAKLDTIGRTIGNMKNGYVVTDSDTEITLHQLTSIGDPTQTLEFINRELFFNTLTEFMTSGLGQSGSRSATEEHKSSYELKCDVLTRSVEKKIDMLIRELIDISYFGPQKTYPEFKFNSVSKIDMTKTADSLVKLYAGQILVKQDGDEEFIRNLFDMPEKLEAMKQPEGDITDIIPNVSNGERPGRLKALSFAKVLSVDEQRDFIAKTFDVKKVDDLFLGLQTQAMDIINEVSKKYAKYVISQYSLKQKADIKYDIELKNRLMKLYRSAYTTGKEDVIREIALCSRKEFKNDKVPDNPPASVLSQSLTRYADKLLFDIRIGVEEELDKRWDWENGDNEVVSMSIEDNMDDWYKTDKRSLIDRAVDGYGDGRGEAIDDNKDNIDLVYYNSILDKNLCDNCALLTGSVMSLQEADKMGLMSGVGRVNPDCDGGQYRCRCNLVVYKVKGDWSE